MYNCFIKLALVMTLSLNVYCMSSSMDKSTVMDKSNQQHLKIHPFGSTIEAEDFDYTNGASLSSCSDDSKRITNLVDSTIVGYFGVDFGDGANKLLIRYGDGHVPGTIFTTSIYWQHPSDTFLLGSFNTTSTGGSCTYTILEAPIYTSLRNLNDIYFLFSGSISVSAYEMDWFSLSA
ncbi:hypothetical protein CHUAL_013983 [Chamberlinius hualienensis]